ncbi:MAG: PDZ domain-containing protein [Caldilineaceae bacterium]
MKSKRHIVRWAVLLLLLGLLTACFARLREMGTRDTAPQPQTLAPAPTQPIIGIPTPMAPGTVVPPPTEPVTVGPTTTPNLSSGQIITTVNTDYVSDMLGVVVDEHMKVLHVEVASAAEKAGIQVGDILDTLDATSFVKDREKVRAKIIEPKPNKKLKLKFKRADKALEVDVSPAPPNPQPVEGTGTPVPTPQDYF